MAKKKSSKVHDKLQRKISGMPIYLMLPNYVPNAISCFTGIFFWIRLIFRWKLSGVQKLPKVTTSHKKMCMIWVWGRSESIAHLGIAKLSNERISKK
jgi:hypothetical protein